MSSGFQTTEELLAEAIDLMDDDEYGAAMPLLARVVSFEPKNEVAYELWLNCHVRLGRFERALELADAGLANGFVPVGMHITRCGALRGLNREEEAIAAAKAAVEADPSSPDAILLVMDIAGAAGQASVVIEYGRRYLRLFEKDAEVLDLMGRAYLVQADFRRADRAFRDAAQLEPEAVRHHVNVLLVAQLTGNNDAFAKYLDRLDPELADEVE